MEGVEFFQKYSRMEVVIISDISVFAKAFLLR